MKHDTDKLREIMQAVENSPVLPAGLERSERLSF